MWVYSKDGNLVNLENYKSVVIVPNIIDDKITTYQILAIENTRDEHIVLWEGDNMDLARTKLGGIGINVGAKWI